MVVTLSCIHSHLLTKLNNITCLTMMHIALLTVWQVYSKIKTPLPTTVYAQYFVVRFDIMLGDTKYFSFTPHQTAVITFKNIHLWKDLEQLSNHR
ncbi:hypothetical protein D9M71_744990 [compost metagenome]